MTIVDFITELFCCVDDKLSQHGKNHKHSQAKLYILSTTASWYDVNPIVLEIKIR